MLVNNLHSLVEDWQNSFHKIFLIRGPLQLIPLVSVFLCFLFFFFSFSFDWFWDSSLTFLDFFVSGLFGLLNHFDEVVRLENCTMWLDFHYILANELVVGDNLLSDRISHVDDAVFVRMGLIVKENVLGAIVCLINEQQLCGLSVIIVVFPGV